LIDLELFLLVECDAIGRSATAQSKANLVRLLLFANESEAPRIEVSFSDEAIEIVSKDRHEVRATAQAARGAGISSQ
jgi:hypothetical protein